MAGPDKYDPTWMVDQAKNMLSPDATNTTPGDATTQPEGMGRFDGTANTGTTMGEPMAISPAQVQGENTPRWPSGVDNYDPLNLPTPSRVGPLVSPASNPDKGSAGRP